MARVSHAAALLRVPAVRPRPQHVQVQRRLGHHSPAFTLSRYAHLMSEDAGGPLDLDAALRSSPLWPTGDRGAAQFPDTAAAVAVHALRTGA